MCGHTNIDNSCFVFLWSTRHVAASWVRAMISNSFRQEFLYGEWKVVARIPSLRGTYHLTRLERIQRIRAQVVHREGM